MKWLFSLCVVLLSVSFLLIQTNSFSKAEISNKTVLSISDEKNALISISYGKNKKFLVTNRTGDSIEIESIELLDDPEQKIIELGESDSMQILPGTVKDFNITGDPKDLIGEMIKITIRWDGGRAEIKSTIPDQIGKN